MAYLVIVVAGVLGFWSYTNALNKIHEQQTKNKKAIVHLCVVAKSLKVTNSKLEDSLNSAILERKKLIAISKSATIAKAQQKVITDFIKNRNDLLAADVILNQDSSCREAKGTE